MKVERTKSNLLIANAYALTTTLYHATQSMIQCLFWLPSRHYPYPVRAGVGAELLEQFELAYRRRRTDGALLRVLATSGRRPVAASLPPQSVLHPSGPGSEAQRTRWSTPGTCRSMRVALSSAAATIVNEA